MSRSATTAFAAMGVGAMAVVLVAGCGSSSSAAPRSPLEAIYGAPESPAESRAKQLQQEEAVAQCMKEAGWEYKPVDYSAQFNNAAEEDVAATWGTEEFGKKYGYGIVYSYELYELPNLDEDGNYSGEAEQGFVDPNQEYIMSLGPDEQTDYYTALYGDQSNIEPTFDDNGDEVYIAPPIEEQGCQGKASQEVYGDQPWSNQEFNDRMGQLSEDMENDPRLEDATIIWSDCMYEIDPLYDFLKVEEVYEFFNSSMRTAKGMKEVPIDPDTGEPDASPEDLENGYETTETADGKQVAYVGKQKPIKGDALEALRKEELALWKIDNGCQKKAGLIKLRRTLEQELVDVIRTEFPDLVKA